MSTTWMPEPIIVPVDPYDPLYASWREAGPSASFEVEVTNGYGRAPRFFQVDVETAITYHRGGYRVSRVS